MPLAQKLAVLRQESSLVQIHQKLKASLRFGALALPKGGPGDLIAARLQNDIAIRHQFMELWTNTYVDTVLCAALRAVIKHDSMEEYNPRSSESDLHILIVNCLLENRDMVPKELMERESLAAWTWQRTMRRALITILLLDQARQLEIVKMPIFKHNSHIKSSSAVIKELINIVQPCWTYHSRTLTHIGYRLNHSQRPLAGFDYTVRNLAIDFRDGIRLSRLIEIILSEQMYESDSQVGEPPNQMKKLAIYQLSSAKSSKTLSDKLRYPSVSKTAELHNVQIAFNAMSEVKDTALFTTVISAKHIVEGHREKTLTLLWSLLRLRPELTDRVFTQNQSWMVSITARTRELLMQELSRKYKSHT